MTASDGYKLIPPRVSKSLDPSTTTIAELLREAGYATAHYGNWHLSGGGPGRHGYDRVVNRRKDAVAGAQCGRSAMQ